MTMPTVSVIIPTHNRAQFIQRAIASVLEQSPAVLEVIVVDDGSKDETESIVTNCARKDARIRFLRHDRQKGAQAARNTGLRAAQGEWIAFLDSDDQWLPDSLTSRLRAAKERALQVVHSECYVHNAGSASPEPYGVPPMQGRIYSEILRTLGVGPLYPSLMFTREALAKIGFLDESIVSYQEWDTAIRLAKYYEFAFVAEPTFLYDCRHDVSISKDVLRAAKGYEQVVRKHWWAFLFHAGPKGLAAHYQLVASYYWRVNDETQAKRCHFISNLLWPFKPRAILRRASRLLGLRCS
jgi:glycosyltransferase involved in cell wall biosynthesis